MKVAHFHARSRVLSALPACGGQVTMLMRDFRRLIVLLAPTLYLFYLLSTYFRQDDSHRQKTAETGSHSGSSILPKDWLKLHADHYGTHQDDVRRAKDHMRGLQEAVASSEDDRIESPGGLANIDSEKHQQIFSSTTRDKRFFDIDFGDYSVMNPNIIPHPNAQSTWIVVAQERKGYPSFEVREIFCEAGFQEGALRCTSPVIALPIAATEGTKCDGDFTFLNMNVGPHDARVFFGPERPYTVFGSNSMFTCFGQFVQDFEVLAGWKSGNTMVGDFAAATELQRPTRWGEIEKNWFLFWDEQGQVYAHHDIHPKRVFAKILPDGSVGPDLGPSVVAADEQCMSRYMPPVAPESESIHQATNSLKVTMCRCRQRGCIPSEANTFIMTVYQHKTYNNLHSVYEPYIMLFQQQAPFRIHALSKRPLWIHGRQWNSETSSQEMFYVTSISWKHRDRRYHGFLDDEIFIAFGIEDERAGGIDVLASDLFGDLGLCG